MHPKKFESMSQQSLIDYSVSGIYPVNYGNVKRIPVQNILLLFSDIILICINFFLSLQHDILSSQNLLISLNFFDKSLGVDERFLSGLRNAFRVNTIVEV